MQKTRKISCIEFCIKIETPHLGLVPKTPFAPETPERHLFQKKSSPSLFKLDDTLTLSKKLENFYGKFRRKTPSKQINRKTDKGTNGLEDIS